MKIIQTDINFLKFARTIGREENIKKQHCTQIEEYKTKIALQFK